MKSPYARTTRLFLAFLFAFTLGGIAQAEDESGVQEIIDVLQSVIKNLQDKKYGAASSDLDYGYGRFKEQKGIWLAECLVNKFQGWASKGEPKIQTAGPAAFGGGTTVDQTFIKEGKTVKTQILVSPVASGLSGLFNPALMGGAGRSRRFPDGTTAQVQKNKVMYKSGNALVTNTAKKGASPTDVWEVSKDNVNRECLKDFS